MSGLIGQLVVLRFAGVIASIASLFAWFLSHTRRPGILLGMCVVATIGSVTPLSHARDGSEPLAYSQASQIPQTQSQSSTNVMLIVSCVLGLSTVALAATTVILKRRESLLRRKLEMQRAAAQAAAKFQQGEADTARREVERAMAQTCIAAARAKAARADADQMLHAAEFANQARTRFLANFSNEIRTQVNCVLGTAKMLSCTPLDDQQKKYLRVTSNASHSLLDLTSDMIDLSKIETSQVEFEQIEIDLREMFKQISDAVTPHAKQKGLRFQAVAAAQTPSIVIGDPTRLRQVLMNLCSSAIKFTTLGCIFLRAVLDRETEDIIELRFTVTDTGIGVPQNRVDCLFAPFSEVDTTPTRRYGGSGLGLAICRGLVSLMGGQIGVESEVGRGSTFWFTIPFKKAEHQPEPVTEGGLSLDAARVIVSGQDATETARLVELCQQWCQAVEACDDIDQLASRLAVSVDGGAAADIVLIGCQESSTVIEVVEGVRGMFGGSGPAVMAVTDDAMTDAGKAAKETGASEIINRPFDESTLRDALFHSATGCRVDSQAPFNAQSLSSPVRRWSGVRILVAQTNEVNQAVLVELLSEEGFACLLAVSEEEVVERALTGQFDLALVACSLTNGNGLEAIQHIRNAEKQSQPTCRHGPRLPIIAVGVKSTREERQTCLAAGFDEYIGTPFDLRTILKTIASVDERGNWLPSDRTSLEPEAASPATTLIPVVGSTRFDADGFASRCAHNDELMKSLLNDFEVRTPQLLMGIERASNAGDHNRAGVLVATLKTAAAAVGASQVQESAEKLIEACRENDIEAITLFRSQLSKHTREFLIELSEVLQLLGQSQNSQPGLH